MEKAESRGMFAKRRALLDVWVGLIDAMIALDSAVDKKLYLAVPGG